jgi:cytoskeletal protein CcmA (bactofilin family)
MATISDFKTALRKKNIMRKFGPMVFREDYENEEEDLSSFGPTIAKGNLTVRSVKTYGPLKVEENLTAEFIKTNGPLICGGSVSAEEIRTNGPMTIEEDLIAEEIKVNGPASIDGSIEIGTGQINGPFKTPQGVKIDDAIRVNGPFEAKNIEGAVIRINGPIDVTESVIASEEIIIGVSTGSSTSDKDPINAQLLKAPFVAIRGRESRFLGRIISRFTARRPEDDILVETAVPIEADEVILNGVRHTGNINAKNIILENGAEYIGESSSENL